MKKCCPEPVRQLERFLATLFLPEEWIELRFIESWTGRGKRRSRVARPAEWMTRREFVTQYGEILDFAGRERANVYFGVCPRPHRGASLDSQIKTVRCLWCDIDDVTVEDALGRWETAEVPQPSIFVNSGRGVHGYWLLDRDVQALEELASIAVLLPNFYRSFGGDRVQNLSRILRPPGTVNCKDRRNGRPVRRCTLVACHPELRYPLEVFSRWVEPASQQPNREGSQLIEHTSVRPRGCDSAEIPEIIHNLNRPSRDRSRRDFAVVCDLLRHGLTAEEIWPLVANSSKFASNGRTYFDVTITNAERAVQAETAPVNRAEGPS